MSIENIKLIILEEIKRLHGTNMHVSSPFRWELGQERIKALTYVLRLIRNNEEQKDRNEEKI